MLCIQQIVVSIQNKVNTGVAETDTFSQKRHVTQREGTMRNV